MSTIAILPEATPGGSASATLRSVVGSGVAPVLVVAAFLLLLGALYVLEPFAGNRPTRRAALVALLVPLLLTYVGVLLAHSIRLL